jgi:hypothetical protein
VAPQEIDRYLATLDDPKRRALEALRESILEILLPKRLVKKLVSSRMRELGFEP